MRARTDLGGGALHAIKSFLVGAAVLGALSLGIAATCVAQQSATDAGSSQGSSPPEKLEKQFSGERQEEIRRLREQLDAVERRLDAQTEEMDRLEAQLEAAQAEAPLPKPAPHGSLGPARVKRPAQAVKPPGKAQPEGEARPEGEAQPEGEASPEGEAPPEGGATRHPGVAVSFGGFFAGEFVRRSLDTANDIATAYDGEYFANDPLAHTSQSLFSSRRSRLSVLVRADPGRATHLSAFGEIDFEGAAQTANSVESNSYNPHLMQLYGAADWDDPHLHLLFGQAWSLVTLNSRGIAPGTVVIPPTIDGSYVPGFAWARQPQIRVTQDIGRRVWIALSLENPQTTFYTGPNPLPSGVNLLYETHGTGLGYNSQNTLSLNHIPDAVLKVAGDASLGAWTVHVEAFALHRSFYEELNYASNNVSGSALGGGLVLPLVPRWLELQVSGMVGRGIGRYGSAQLPDVTFDPTGVIQPIRELIALAGLRFHPLSRLDIYLFAGQEKASRESFDYTDTTASTPTTVPYGYGDINYSNAGCVSETAMADCVGNLRLVEQGTFGLWYEPYRGSFGTLRWGLQLSRTEFKAFAGVGGAPVATLNMVFTSLRYYPWGR
jgi:hypothetical protein